MNLQCNCSTIRALRTCSFTAGLQTSAVCNIMAKFIHAHAAFEQGLSFTLQKFGKGHLTLKKKQLSAIHSAYDQEDVFVWLLTGLIVYECLLFYLITS